MTSSGKFWRITLDTNPDFCNLNCIMCEDHSPYSKDRQTRKKEGLLRPLMNKELLEKVIREAAQLGFSEVIPSTMGEPLLYPHFDRILELCRELNLKLNLTTNGTFPSKDKLRNVEFWAERIVPIGSDVKISWNGATKKTHEAIMINSHYQQQLDNAKRFIAVRDKLATNNYCKMTMQITFLKSNLDEIPAMLELAIRLGFDRLKGHHLWAHFSEIKALSLRNDIAHAKRWNEVVDECHTIVVKHNANEKRQFKLENFFKLDTEQLEDIAPDGNCPFLEREIWIDPTGRFNVCCAPDQQRKTLGDFGNIGTDSIATIINSRSYRELVETYHHRPLCKECNMRRPSV